MLRADVFPYGDVHRQKPNNINLRCKAQFVESLHPSKINTQMFILYIFSGRESVGVSNWCLPVYIVSVAQFDIRTPL